MKLAVFSRRSLVSCLLLAACLAALAGCEKPQPATPPGGRLGFNAEAQSDALGSAIELLDNEAYATDEGLQQAVARVTQWLMAQPRAGEWQPDALVSTLPDEYREGVAGKRYDDLGRSNQWDGRYLQFSLWLRDLAERLGSQPEEDLELASRLFDWVVRNMQLEPPDGEAEDPSLAWFSSAMPWETLLAGRGTVSDRAWLFLLLARDRGLDAVVLGLPAVEPDAPPEVWAVGVLVGDQLHVFDPQLGLPIPGPEGKGVATLAQLEADDALLRQLDLEGEAYPLSAADVKDALILLDASPFSVSRRMQIIEDSLSADRKLQLTSDPTAQAERLSTARGSHDVRLWSHPFRALAAHVMRDQRLEQVVRSEMYFLVNSTPLRRGRLNHIRGRFDGDHGAKQSYMQMRLRESEIERQADEARMNVYEIQAMEQAKQDASYWLGLVTFEEDELGASIDHLRKRTLDAWPEGRWTSGAHYNLGRAYEAQGKVDQAVAEYQATDALQQYGNRLRARWLQLGLLSPGVANSDVDR